MSLQTVQSLNQELFNLIATKDFNNPRASKLILQLKLSIYTVPNIHLQPEQFLIEARNFAQYNVFYSLAANNIEQFSRAIDKLTFFYDNFPALKLSNNSYQLEAINLLYLLSYNKIEEFYTKLETLDTVQLSNEYINYVVKLNEAIEEGNYRLVFNSRKVIPLEFFGPFLNRIEQTIREQVARSSEKAYSSLSFPQALEIFQLQNEDRLKQFISSQRDKEDQTKIRWTVQGTRIIFENRIKRNAVINSQELIVTMLRYSNEIEKIV